MIHERKASIIRKERSNRLLLATSGEILDKIRWLNYYHVISRVSEEEWLRVWRIRIFLQVGAIDIWKQCKNAKYFKVAKTATLFLYFQIVLAFLLRLLASTDGAWVKWSRMEQESIK